MPALNPIEKRYLNDAEVRVEGGSAGKPTKITGYALLYNSPSKPMKTARGTAFSERIAPGAIGTIEGRDIMGRYNHQLILGRTSSGTMKLFADDKGLRYEITPTDSAAADHVVKSIERRDVTGSSFAFRTIKDSWKIENGQAVRELQGLDLIDVGPVDNPAYGGTGAGDAAVSLRAEGSDEAAIDAQVEQLRSAEAATAPAGEQRYYYNPKASERTNRLRNAVDAARQFYDTCQVIVDTIEADKGVALTPEETRAYADAAKAITEAITRGQEAADALATAAIPAGGVRQEKRSEASATPLLDARLSRRARLV